MRAETTTMMQGVAIGSLPTLVGVKHSCILVYSDGHYRLESSLQDSSLSNPETKVYLDRLPETSLKELQNIIEDEKFKSINAGKPHGRIIHDLNTLAVTIPHKHPYQQFTFTNADERKPYENELKPLLAWMKAVTKRKLPVRKTETANHCVAPRAVHLSPNPL